MALDSIAKYTIAAGARDLNESIHAIGTPTWVMFNMNENKAIEPGDTVNGSVMYKREMTQRGDPGSRDTVGDEFIDPYEHFELPWAYTLTYFNIPQRELGRNLGGFSVDDLANRNDIMQRIPQGSRNTLVNMLAPRFRNLEASLVELCGADFFEFGKDEEGREGPRGIDIITQPDTEYGGLAYNALAPTKWKSQLMDTYPHMWNPLHKKLTGQDISIEHLLMAADDIQSMHTTTTLRPTKELPWVNFLMSRGRFTRFIEHPLVRAELTDADGNVGASQRRRNSAGDTELGVTNEVVHSRLKVRFKTDPNMTTDKKIYFWKQGVIKKCMQRERRFPQMISVTRSWNQPIIKITAETEYQYRCDERVSTGYIETDQGL